MEYKTIEGGVCAAKGFMANGLNCGLNPVKEKNDLGLIYSIKECDAAAVYTQNKVKGAPILVTKSNLEKTGGKARAVIVNSKNANTCNADGEEKAWQMCKLAAEGHFAEARVINQRLMPLHNKLFVEPNPIPVKWACKELGLVATDTLRLPMTPITDSGRETVRAALKHAGLL